MKPDKLIANHFMIVNLDFNDSVDSLNIVLDKISNMSNITEKYTTKLNVFSYPENSKYFKRLLLEHSTNYFIDLNINVKLSQKEYAYEAFKESSKKNIIIIDFDFFEDLEYISKLSKLPNVQLVLLNSVYDNSFDLYKLMNNVIVMHTKERRKYERKFYSKFVKKIDTINEVEYYNINHSHLVYKNKKLCYI